MNSGLVGWLVFAALIVVGAMLVALLSDPRRRRGRHRAQRYLCERWSQRVKDWWAWWRALQ